MIRKTIYLFVGTVLLAITIYALVYPFAHRKMITNLAAGSQVIETLSGPIEYAIQGDASTALQHLIILHGSPGGYDAGVMLAEWLKLDESTYIIIPSRPGYLRTPIEVGIQPSEAARSLIGLLDALDVSKAAVLGWSGAGPTAIELAQNYPQRIKGLVLLSARIRGDGDYTFEESDDSLNGFDPEIVEVESDFTAYMKMAGFYLMPKFILKKFFPDDVQSKNLTVDRLIQVSSTTQPPSLRTMGRYNDIWQFASLSREPVFNIAMPTLIIHSPIDESVDFKDQALYLASALPHAELFVVDNESHFSTLNSDAIVKIRAFLESLE